ncbi:Glutaminyl-peptide cyclotransferase [Linum grandiflorum]
MGATRSLKKKIKRSPPSTNSNSNLLPMPTSSLNWRTKSPLFVSLAMASTVILLLCISSIVWNSFSPASVVVDATPQIYTIQVVNEYPHDPEAFTQGLLYAGNDSFYESTGLYDKSTVRRVSLQTGKVDAIQDMDGQYFGEGLTLIGERLFQVTWLTRTGFLYHRSNLSKIGEFSHPMEDGWGLATDGKVLFGSDGTSKLYELDPLTFKVMKVQTVKYNNLDVHYINELEYINGEIWANVWQTDCIARISPRDGNVVGWILLPQLSKGLRASGHRGIDVLNGIAWDSEKKRLFVTGKLWPKLYEIKLHPVRKQISSENIEQLCVPP